MPGRTNSGIIAGVRGAQARTFWLWAEHWSLNHCNVHVLRKPLLSYFSHHFNMIKNNTMIMHITYMYLPIFITLAMTYCHCWDCRYFILVSMSEHVPVKILWAIKSSLDDRPSVFITVSEKGAQRIPRQDTVYTLFTVTGHSLCTIWRKRQRHWHYYTSDNNFFLSGM